MKKRIDLNISGELVPVLFDGVRVSSPEFPDEPVDYTAPCGVRIPQAVLVEICKTKTKRQMNEPKDQDRILFRGVGYPIKEWDGYHFAAESLLAVLTGTDGLFLGPDAESVDSAIAYYFPDEDFNSMAPEQLHEIYEQHS